MTNNEGAVGAGRRAHAEALLARYPSVSADELTDLLHWFRKEATALEIGLIASDPALADPYRQFSARHIDKLTAVDAIRALIFAAALLAVLALLFWLAV